jgi:hypothetical protein
MLYAARLTASTHLALKVCLGCHAGASVTDETGAGLQVFKAIADGYDVRGIYYWTLMDNFEWNAGYLMKFGVYYYDEKNPHRNYSLKPGGQLLAKIYKSMPVQMDELRKHCVVCLLQGPGLQPHCRPALLQCRPCVLVLTSCAALALFCSGH